MVPAFRRLLIVCFSASGAAALMYQVAWVRLLTLSFGHTVAAASTVLAAFMAGLAAGAWMAGRFPPRRSSALVVYAVLELCIAAVAIALPIVLPALDPFLVSAYADGRAPAWFAITRVAVCLPLLGLPAAAMGATYPIAVAWLASIAGPDARDARPTASAAGVLYTANSAGAAAGALAAGFWLIETLGIRGTTWIAVALNVAAAAVALWLALADERSVLTTVRPAGRGRRATAPYREVDIPYRLLPVVAAALSGFAALVYEVAWTRLLALIIGPTTYAFSLMAASFIAGIALGSPLGVRLGRSRTGAAFFLGAMLVATAVITLMAGWFATSFLPVLVARDIATRPDFESVFFRQALAVVAVLLPASVSLGATFTLAVAAASSGPAAAARETARIYTANTLGAVTGALAAGFLLVPWLGLQATFLHTSHLLLGAGIFVAALASMPSTKRRLGGGALGLLITGGLAATAIAFAVPAWDRDLITSGGYKYARQMPVEDLESTLRAGHLEYYKEGAAGTVSVRRLAGSLSLAIDGKVDASNAGDMLTQRLLGLLPVLLHPEPRDALVIGLGSGVTADAVLASRDVRRVDIVEISPEVAEASAFFDRENHEVLKKPGVRLLIGDGRSHLRLSDAQYDVIISEPSNPWMAGVAALFTREFFEAARARLRTGGVFCQWAHSYEIAEEDLRSIVQTFASVFPEGSMWLVGEGDLLLIGSDAANLDARLSALAGRTQSGNVPALLADLGIPPGAAPFVLLSLYAGGPREIAPFGYRATTQTDDRMSLEFTAARAMYAPPSGSAGRVRDLAAGATLPAAVVAAMRNAGAEDWSARGFVALRAGAFGTAHDSFRRAVALDSRSADALRGSTEAAAGTDSLTSQVEWLETLAAQEPQNALVRVELSRVLANLGRANEAVAAADDAVRIDPSRPEPLEQLGSVMADVGDAARLAPIADALITRFPARDEGRYYRAAALFIEGRAPEAEAAINTLLKLNPGHAKGQNLRGVVCATLKNTECALEAFRESVRLSPRDPSAYVNLGHFHLERGDPRTAVNFFSEALAIDANASAARQGLTDARAALPERR
jgi:spermidine synthase